MGRWARCLLAIAMSVLSWSVATDTAAAATATYRTPGYTGTSKPVVTGAAPTLPPVIVGSGNDPSVVVDAAGTAHIAWTTDDGAQADGLHYCRLPRGASQCDASTVLRPEPPAGGDYDPGYNIEGGGPQLYVLGSQLVMVSHRISTSGFAHPDGSLGGTTLVYVSQDGGSTWSPVNGVPQYGIVGTSEIGGPGVTYGSDTDPKIGVISPLDSDGTFFQELSPGAFTSQSALIGPGLSEGSAGSLALNGDKPIAAFHGPSNGTIDVRGYTGAGNANDVANWGSTFQFPGSNPQLASGPSGLYLLDSELNYGKLSVHKLNATPASASDPKITEAKGTAISEDNANDAYLSEGPDGSLFAAWSGTAGLRLNSARHGSSWSSAQGTTIDKTTQDLNETTLGVAADGGGFAVVHQGAGTSTEAKIVAVPFGNQAATNQSGLGDLPGGHGNAAVSEGCRTLTFGPVKAQVLTGCFLKGAKGASDDEVSDGAITVNGVTITPDPVAHAAARSAHSTSTPIQIIVNAHTGTIDSTGPVTVSMTNAAPAIVIWHGAIHLDLHGAKVGDILFDFPPQGHEVDGFPVKGDIVVKIAAGYGVAVPLSAALPDWASGFTPGATLTSNVSGGLNQGSLELKIADMPLGALELKNVDITYQPLSDTWTGTATLEVPAGDGGFKAKLDITFAHGKLTQAAVATEIPPPGIPVYTDIYVHEFHGSFTADPFSLSIGGRIGLYLPSGATNFPIDVDGTLTATFGPPDVFALNGELDVFGVNVGTGNVRVAFDPFSFSVAAQLDLLGLVQGSAAIDIDPPNYSGSGSFDVLGLNVAAYVSNHAIAGCAATKHLVKVHAGFVYYWGADFDFLIGKGGCDLPATVQAHVGHALLRVPHGDRAHDVPVTGASFTVAPGTAYEDINVRTAAGTPAVTLQGPDGQTVTPVQITTASTSVPAGATTMLATDKQAVIMLPAPAAGVWTVLPTPGAPAITSADSARGFTPPTLHASLVHSGGHLAIRYQLTRRAGVKVTFIEHGRHLDHVIKSASGGSGTIALVPSPGPGGRRSIEALVQDGSEPLSRPAIGTFVAPAPIRPAAPSLKVTLRGRNFRVGLSAPAGVQGVLVRLKLSDGRSLARTVTGGTHTLAVPVLGFSDSLHVTATVSSPTGTISRAATATGHYPAPRLKRQSTGG